MTVTRSRPLAPDKARRAFTRFFGIGAPTTLVTLDGLTPGDLAVVARKLRYDPVSEASETVARLGAETAAKRGFSRLIGF